QTPHSSCANRELDESKLAQTPHTGAHSWQSRIDAAMYEALLRPSSTQTEHQCRHWRHASIARSTSGLEPVILAMKDSPFELTHCRNTGSSCHGRQGTRAVARSQA